uniref:Uncharacterized protein n=1 Tax=Arundo donax TaxID=35708 RepID=A0A0A9AIJ9_ARUDO
MCCFEIFFRLRVYTSLSMNWFDIGQI